MRNHDSEQDNDLKGDDTFVLLFLVDPGAKIESFSTGSQAFKGDDLGGELVAPN